MNSNQEAVFLTIGTLVLLVVVVVGATCQEQARRNSEAREHHGCVQGHVVYSCGDGNKPIETFKCDEKSPEAP
jgi:hypothetical protein